MLAEPEFKLEYSDSQFSILSTPWCYLFLGAALNYANSSVGTGIARFIVLPFIGLHRYWVFTT